MVIYDLAMKLKLDGEKFYNNCSHEEEDEVVKQIYKILADDERRQYEIIKKIKALIPHYIPSAAPDRAKKVFLGDGVFVEKGVIGAGQLTNCQKAIEKQQECLYIYNRLVDEVEHNYEKEIFRRLSKDVLSHISIITNMKELLN